VTTTENAERQVRMSSQCVQWTPLLLVISIFACENMHSVALGSLGPLFSNKNLHSSYALVIAL